MSFTLKLENSRILKGIVETLASIIDETEFRVTPKEFTISAMDPSRICLLKLSIKKDDFDVYECSKESKVELDRNIVNDTINDLSFRRIQQLIEKHDKKFPKLR